MSHIAKDVTKLVGNTPLVRINRITNQDATVLGKLEFFNPASSVKDRIGVSIVDAAERDGSLKPGGTIIEATSGNTGIALALVGAARGYHVVITLPASLSKERRALVRAFGAELVLTDPKAGVKGAVEAANRIKAERPGSIIASQFTNPANPEIHRRTTAEEIWRDTDGDVDVVVSGVGTGGTVSGIGEALKHLKPSIRIVAVQPKESPLLTGGGAAPHGIQGIGPNFVADTYNPKVVDEVVSIDTDTAIAYARRAAAQEGLLVGISSGAALAAANELASRPENKGKEIVAILPDTGERYLSTPAFAGLEDD